MPPGWDDDVTDWFETLDDSLWLRPDAGGQEEADFISRCLRLRSGQSVLDAPCGAGRVALPLAKQGLRVVGIDLRRRFVSRGRRRFRRDGLPGDLLEMDLRRIAFVNQFHGVFNWFNSFGYFDDEENADLIHRYARALRPGGRLLIDQVNRERILRDFRPEAVNSGVLYKSRWEKKAQRIHLRRVVDGRDDPRNRSSQRWYTPAQMRALLAEAGLRLEAIYGSIGGESYTRGSRHMITIARKSG